MFDEKLQSISALRVRREPLSDVKNAILTTIRSYAIVHEVQRKAIIHQSSQITGP